MKMFLITSQILCNAPKRLSLFTLTMQIQMIMNPLNCPWPTKQMSSVAVSTCFVLKFYSYLLTVDYLILINKSIESLFSRLLAPDTQVALTTSTDFLTLHRPRLFHLSVIHFSSQKSMLLSNDSSQALRQYLSLPHCSQVL